MTTYMKLIAETQFDFGFNPVKRREVNHLAYVHVQTLLSKEDHRSLKIEALDKGISLTQLMKQIINNYLTKKEE